MEKGTVGKQAVAFLQSSLDTAVNGLHSLDENPSFWHEAIDEYATIQDKLIVESLLLVLIVERFRERSPEIQQRLQNICEFCIPLVYTPKNRMLVSRYPHTAITFGISHFALKQMGYGDAVFGRTIESAFRSRQVHAIERLPYRSMEARWLQSLLFKDQRACFDDLLLASILKAQAHPLRMSTSDSYAFTHALMYVTDFGDQPLPENLEISHLESLNDQLIAAQIVNENLDILGELLMSAMFLSRPWSVRARFAWHFLAETWNQFGILPSPSFEAKEYAKLSAKDARAYAFKHTYHTIYVGAILCSLILRRPEVIVSPATDCLLSADISLDKVMQRIDECPSLRGLSSCQWTKVFQGSSIGQTIGQAELSAMLCDGLAVHAVQQYDLVTLCGLLESQFPSESHASKILHEVKLFLIAQANSGGLPSEIVERIATVVGECGKFEGDVVEFRDLIKATM